jgi:hypothetical protein
LERINRAADSVTAKNFPIIGRTAPSHAADNDSPVRRPLVIRPASS